jgi:hypothetical protein
MGSHLIGGGFSFRRIKTGVRGQGMADLSNLSRFLYFTKMSSLFNTF